MPVRMLTDSPTHMRVEAASPDIREPGEVFHDEVFHEVSRVCIGDGRSPPPQGAGSDSVELRLDVVPDCALLRHRIIRVAKVLQEACLRSIGVGRVVVLG